MIAVLCLVPQMQHAKFNREIRRLDNPLLHDQKGSEPGARHGRSEDQRAYYQAKNCLRKAHKNGFESIPHLFRRTKSIEARRRTSDGLKSFEDVLTNSQKKTTHTLPPGKNGNDTKRFGR